MQRLGGLGAQLHEAHAHTREHLGRTVVSSRVQRTSPRTETLAFPGRVKVRSTGVPTGKS